MSDQSSNQEILLEIRNGTKRYAGVAAFEGVDFDLRRGEIHAVVGENGAGKSTLVKVMAGVVTLNEGQMLLQGKPINPRTPVEARDLGIGMVFQENSLVPTMTAAQNLFLGQENQFNRIRRINIEAQQFFQSLQFDVDPVVTTSLLGAAKKQMVEIARAVKNNAQIIIFDEPTASLTPEEKLHFFMLINHLKERGVSIIFISHALEEAMELSDRITILRDGKKVITDATQKFDRERIVKAMVGRDLSQTIYGQTKQTARPPGKKVLTVRNLRMGGLVKSCSLSVFAGQVTGVFGLVGSGRTETFKIVAGVMKRDFRYGGDVLLNDKPVSYLVPAKGVKDGIAYITEDRKAEGFFEERSIAGNVYTGLLAKLRGKRKLINNKEADEVGQHWSERLNVRTINTDVRTVELSGGNQQTVVIARALVQSPDLVIFDEPTRGVDVGAIEEIHKFINQLADEGKPVVVISSYLPEIMALSDRILVFRMGKMVEEFAAQEATEEKIMYAAIH